MQLIREKMIDIGIVVVDFHTPKRSIAYLKDIRKQEGVSWKLALVICEYSIKEVEVIVKEFSLIKDGNVFVSESKDLYLLLEEENLGYSKGNNRGAYFLTQLFEFKYLLFSNNDIQFSDNSNIRILFNFYENRPEIGALGPQIINLANKYQNPYKKLGLFEKYLFRNFFAGIINKLFKKKLFSGLIEDAEEGFYYRLMGCFLMIKTKSFFTINGFDENTFLFGEEAIMAEKLKSIKKHFYYYPKVSIIHEQGVSYSRKRTINKKILKLEFDSDMYYYRHYLKYSQLGILFTRFIFEIYLLIKTIRLSK